MRSGLIIRAVIYILTLMPILEVQNNNKSLSILIVMIITFGLLPTKQILKFPTMHLVTTLLALVNVSPGYD
jgi:hypothetical protein